MRVLVDACAIPYVMRESAKMRDVPASSAKLRVLAALIRRLRGGWSAIGTYSRGVVHVDERGALIEIWRAAPIASHPDGDATLVTLIVQSTSALLLEGMARDVDDARSELEALSSVYTNDVIEVELVTDGQRVHSIHARALLSDPPLREVPGRRTTCCTSCGLPLGWLADEIERCSDCASRLAA